MSDKYMKQALIEACEGISKGHGGPFGSVVVRQGSIVGRGHNRVLEKHDPTCHGEIEAIRDACKKLGTHDLSGCVLYTTAEPCPMCLGAIMWANITEVYYGCTKLDTAEIGFRDDDFYKHLSGEAKVLELQECDRQACLELFAQYDSQEKELY